MKLRLFLISLLLACHQVYAASTSTCFDTDCSNMLNFNSDFSDSSILNATPTTFGDVAIDAAVKKFGAGSATFDGTADYVTYPSNAAYGFTGDFTIDAWVYLAAAPPGTKVIVSTRDTGTAVSGWFFQTTNTGLRMTDDTSSTAASKAATWLATTWTHVAVVRSGNDMFLFQDGSLLGGASTDVTGKTFAINDLGAPLQIGTRNSVSGHTEDFNGKIDAVRITNGTAIWTAPFTAPSSEYSSCGGGPVTTSTAQASGIGVSGDFQVY